ncbi:vicilin-like seed storage protein At2g18540 [Coffea eugenioides]|uniref:vicilin-like seed storage protein At2g18540 n=1 Tax=Coffea eugenioides TaxID=49369 RepID=UPI000F60982F|nr:vicilin-like seed storage protein At2g18540 [Coffea eugenioides]
MSTEKLLSASSISLLGFGLCLFLCVHATAGEDGQIAPGAGHLVKKGERQPIISTEFGEVSGVRVSDGNETFNIHLITLEPNSLFLPVMLHQDMVFYVHTGSGNLSYRDEHKRENTTIRRGDVYRLGSGSVFFIQSDVDLERQKLRIYAIFGNAGEDLREPTEYGPYSSIRDLVLGFDKKILQETFKVPEEVMEEITSGRKPEAIVRGLPGTQEKTIREREYQFIEAVFGSTSIFSIFETSNKDKKKSNIFNIFQEKRDFENCNGWSTTVTRKKYSVLKGSKYGLFMVNLTRGGMMGPHWNPEATEIAVVLQGKGMVRVVCPSLPNKAECKNARFGVEEGDIFAVQRFHPMAQMAFNNDTLVFVGFSTSTENNHPQYLAGKASVLRTLDKHILAASFGINETTFDRLVNQQRESVILECTSCAEEEWRIMEEEIEREREEARKRDEERKRQEEEAETREEEEAVRERAEEERKKREQEEEEEAARRKREEEAARERREQEEREQEAAQMEEKEREAAARREEEAAKREEEEAAQRRQEEAGQGEGGRPHEGGREARPPEEDGRGGVGARQEEETAKQLEKEMGQEEEQGNGQGWGRRILKNAS